MAAILKIVKLPYLSEK